MTFITSWLHDWGTYGPQFLAGLRVSVEATLGAVALGVPLGLCLAVGVMSKRRVVHIPALLFVEAGRGMPALLVLQLIYFGLPGSGITLGSLTATILALGLNTGAYSSEYIRGGLQSVPQRQIAAAEALNMSHADILRFIVIPQGMRVAIPPVLGYCILTFQGTSLAFTIALPELMSKADSAASLSFHYISLFAIAGVLYACITIPASQATLFLERRLGRHVRVRPARSRRKELTADVRGVPGL